MKKIELGQMIRILADIGVIAGIVFLGLELHQNNQLLEAEARFNRLQLSWNGWQSTAQNSDLAEIGVKARRGETLTDVERVRIDAVSMRIIITMEWLFRELPENSPERVYMTETLRGIFYERGRGALSVWKNQKHKLDPGFVKWVEENVITN